MHSINFVVALSQADILTDIYIYATTQSTFQHHHTISSTPKTSIFWSIQTPQKSILKDARQTWNHHLRSDLLKYGWKQYHINKCIFVKPGLPIILYVGDACIISHNKLKIQSKIKSLQKDYDLADDGKLQDYIDTRFDPHSNGSVTLT